MDTHNWGYVLDEIAQLRRNAKAAQRLLKRLLHKQGCRPRRMVTDKLNSCLHRRNRQLLVMSLGPSDYAPAIRQAKFAT